LPATGYFIRLDKSDGMWSMESDTDSNCEAIRCLGCNALICLIGAATRRNAERPSGHATQFGCAARFQVVFTVLALGNLILHTTHDDTPGSEPIIHSHCETEITQQIEFYSGRAPSRADRSLFTARCLENSTMRGGPICQGGHSLNTDARSHELSGVLEGNSWDLYLDSSQN